MSPPFIVVARTIPTGRVPSTQYRDPMTLQRLIRLVVPLAAAVCATCSGALAATATRDAAAPRAIVLVSIDGARAGLDDWPEVMPNLAKWSASGARFEWATTPTPLTLSATASLLTGLEPSHTGLRREALDNLNEKTKTLADGFTKGGFATLGLPGDALAHGRTGLSRGFAAYHRESPNYSDSARVDSALAFVSRPGRRFVWLGLSMGQPSQPARRYMNPDVADPARYRARAAAIDGALAHLAAGLAERGQLDRTIVVVVGTHGFGVPGWPLQSPVFDEPGLPGRGLDLSESAVRVPLVFIGPIVAKRHGQAALPAAWTSTLDVAPTLLEAAGLPATGFDGVSLWPSLAGQPLKDRVLVHETDADRILGWMPRRAARSGDSKLLAYGDRTLLLKAKGASPAAASVDPTSALVAAIRTTGAQAVAPTPATEAEAVQTRDTENAIIPLMGRWIMTASQPFDSVGMRQMYQLGQKSPTNLLAKLESAVLGTQAGNDDAAAVVYLQVVDHYPDFPEAVITYADHLLHFKHADKVPEEILKLPARTPLLVEGMWREVISRTARLQFGIADKLMADASEFSSPPGRLFKDTRKTLGNLIALQTRVAANRDSAALRLQYGKALLSFGLFDDGFQELNRSRFIDPSNPEPDLVVGHYLMLQGKIEAARNAYARAVVADRDNLEGIVGVAESWLAVDRRREALPHLQRAVEVAPRDPRLRYNLACVLASQGRVDEAGAELERAVDLGYSDWARIATDEDLLNVRSTDAYKRVIAKAPAEIGAGGKTGSR